MPARPAAPVPAMRSSVATTALPCESCPVTMRRTSSAMAFLLYEFIVLGRVAFDRDDRHCQLKRLRHARRVGGAAARVGELLCSPIMLPRSSRAGPEKGALR